MKYKALFQIGILHDFYGNRQSLDIDLVPTQNCRRLLKGHRVVIKYLPNGLLAALPLTASGQPLIDMGDHLVFSFEMKVNNTSFFQFTDLSSLTSGKIFLFSNSTISDVTETKLIKTTIEGRGILGRIDIHNNSSLPTLKENSEVRKFNINFESKKVSWKYYVVDQAWSNEEELLIEDVEILRSSAPYTFNSVNLNSSPDPEDDMGIKLTQKFPSATIIRFQSDQEISYKEEGRKSIQLKKSDKILIPHLANPKPSQSAKHVVTI